MSSNLRAEPVNRKKLDLGTSLKFVLRKALGEPVNSVIDENFISFLSGVAFSGNDEARDDANKLIKFIEDYGEVNIKEEY